MKNLFLTASLGAVLVACSQIPKEAYYARGHPDSLIDNSSEVVNLKISSPANIEELTSWINHNQPTRAELKCTESDALCSEAQSVLRQFGVPVKYSSSVNATGGVSLIYERIQARDCENRYIDNMINPYNLNHPTFGCTLAVNMVQMISDKGVLVNPKKMDLPDASKAAQSAGFYNLPASYSASRVDPNFQAIATQENISSSDGSSGGTAR